jgi:hypothetical protein
MKAHDNDPSSMTRANLLEAIRNIHDFDAGGQIRSIDYADDKTPLELVIDPVKEYRG